MEELFKLAANYGFPIVVAGYFEPIIKELKQSIVVLTVVVAKTNGVDYDGARVLVDGRRQ